MNLRTILPLLVVLLAVLGVVFSFLDSATPDSRPDLDRRDDAGEPIPAPDALHPGARARSEGMAEGEGGVATPNRNLRVFTEGPATLSSVDRGLRYLKDTQAEDGSWSAGPNAGTGPAVTGLVLLSCFGAGQTHKHGNFRKTIKNGLKHLKIIQDPRGCFGDPADADHAANHAIATLAMCESYALTGSPLFKQSAQQGVDFITRQRRPGTSVAFWELLALHSGDRAGLRVLGFTKRDALDWLDGITDRTTGVAACATGGVMPKTVAGQTAAAVLCRIFYGEDPGKSDLIAAAAEYLVARRPGTGERDPGLVYFGSLALFQCGGKPWKQWNQALLEHEFGDQIRTGKHAGAWEPQGRSGDLVGRPGTTALRMMTQQVYYRYGRVFGATR